MESRRVVVDTSIFIEYLRAKDKQHTTLYALSAETEILISAVTLYELYMGATNDEKVKDIKLLTDDLTILSFNKEIAVAASEIYHYLRLNNKMIEFRDIFIAATCIIHNLPVKTLNKKHFERIEGLLID